MRKRPLGVKTLSCEGKMNEELGTKQQSADIFLYVGADYCFPALAANVWMCVQPLIITTLKSPQIGDFGNSA